MYAVVYIIGHMGGEMREPYKGRAVSKFLGTYIYIHNTHIYIYVTADVIATDTCPKTS